MIGQVIALVVAEAAENKARDCYGLSESAEFHGDIDRAEGLEVEADWLMNRALEIREPIIGEEAAFMMHTDGDFDPFDD